MKTTIGVTQSGRFSPQIENIASEFFGILSKTSTEKDSLLWFTFPSKKSAIEFSQAISLICVDKNKKVLE